MVPRQRFVSRKCGHPHRETNLAMHADSALKNKDLRQYSFHYLLRQRLFVTRLDAFLANHAQHIAEAAAQVAGAEAEDVEVALLVEAGAGHVQLAAARVNRDDD